MACNSADSYFSEEVAPCGLDATLHSVQKFIQLNGSCGKMALVTSGGTTVPLEKKTVRFIDNFSRGSRGAASAEYFIKHGYAVLFLSRTHSKQPYLRQFSLNDIIATLTSNLDLLSNSEEVSSNSVHCVGLSDKQIKVLHEFKKVLIMCSIDKYLFSIKLLH